MRTHPIAYPSPWAWVWYYCECGTTAEFWLSLFAALFHCAGRLNGPSRIAMAGPLQCGVSLNSGIPLAGSAHDEAICALSSYTMTVHPYTLSPNEIAAPAAETSHTGPARGWAGTAARIGAALWFSIVCIRGENQSPIMAARLPYWPKCGIIPSNSQLIAEGVRLGSWCVISG